MKLLWLPTGDTIDLVPLDHMLDTYHDVITTAGSNCFHMKHNRAKVDLIDQLRTVLHEVHDVLCRANIAQFGQFTSANLLDQTILNQLHLEYVKLSKQYNISVFIEKLGGDKNLFHRINALIHQLEETWIQHWTNDQWFPNPDNSTLNFEYHNVYLEYQDYGRRQWDYFLFHGTDFADQSDHVQLSGNLVVNLLQPVLYHPPANYVDWCKQHNKSVVGMRLNLADIHDLPNNLTKYRELFARNSGLRLSIEC